MSYESPELSTSLLSCFERRNSCSEPEPRTQVLLSISTALRASSLSSLSSFICFIYSASPNLKSTSACPYYYLFIYVCTSFSWSVFTQSSLFFLPTFTHSKPDTCLLNSFNPYGYSNFWKRVDGLLHTLYIHNYNMTACTGIEK